MTRPLQNRVAPGGRVHARPERGLMMGNRGRLHGPDRRLGGRRWTSRAWICCLIRFRGRRREVMGPGYTELFFLDEVTALAAGHRPCFECRRAAAQAFAAALGRAAGTPPPRAAEMDRALHAERRGPRERLDPETLPDGTVFAADGRFFVRRCGRLLVWDFSGYSPSAPTASGPRPVLTPRTARAALAQGYRPLWHPSAGGGIKA